MIAVIIYLIGVVVAYVGGMARIRSLGSVYRARNAKIKIRRASICSWFMVLVLVWVVLEDNIKK